MMNLRSDHRPQALTSLLDLSFPHSKFSQHRGKDDPQELPLNRVRTANPAISLIHRKLSILSYFQQKSRDYFSKTTRRKKSKKQTTTKNLTLHRKPTIFLTKEKLSLDQKNTKDQITVTRNCEGLQLWQSLLTTACSANIPQRCYFKSWKCSTSYPFSCQCTWEDTGRREKSLGPSTHVGYPELLPDIGLAQSWLLLSCGQ